MLVTVVSAALTEPHNVRRDKVETSVVLSIRDSEFNESMWSVMFS